MIPAYIVAILRDPPPTTADFTPTKFTPSDTKVWFTTHFIRFASSDFPKHQFTNRFYRQVMHTFGFIEHYAEIRIMLIMPRVRLCGAPECNDYSEVLGVINVTAFGEITPHKSVSGEETTMHVDHPLAPETRCRLLAGIAAEHFEDFATWLQVRGYRPRTVQRRLQSLAAWTDWLKAAERERQEPAEALTACIAAVRVRPSRKYQFGPNDEIIGAARLYASYLQATGVLCREPVRSPVEAYPLLREFRAWLLEHCGVTPATVATYLPVLLDLVGALGEAPAAYTAAAVRDFALRRAQRHGPAAAKMTCTAVRAFLRFLGVTKRLPTGMDMALPPVAAWSNPTVPRYLAPDDLEHLLASVPQSGIGLRDRTALLLLGRLGLRAGDVVGLRLSDMDFRAGTLAVAGKGRRGELLPLPQDVGDALIAYVRDARPRVTIPEVFLTALPPLRPMSTQALSALVARTLDKAGISAPTRGCHLLRHSAATSMLRRGASLAGVGAVLRHRRPATTVKYAKADDLRLLAVAQSWPGMTPC